MHSNFYHLKRKRLPNTLLEQKDVDNEADTISRFIATYYHDDFSKTKKENENNLKKQVIFNFILLVIVILSIIVVPFKYLLISIFICAIISVLLSFFIDKINRNNTDKLLDKIYDNNNVVINDFQYDELSSLIKKNDVVLIGYEMIQDIRPNLITMSPQYRYYEIVEPQKITYLDLMKALGGTEKEPPRL